MERKNRRRAQLFLLLLVCVLALPACGENQHAPQAEEVLIFAALNPVSKETLRAIKRFNEAHTDAQIEIHDYSDEGGAQRLLIELMLGQVPDIMEMHYIGDAENFIITQQRNGTPDIIPGRYTGASGEYWMPYRQMAQKGYLEDLWPYIENDPELGRDGVLQAPLKAAEVNGGLYMLFQRAVIFTLIGRESVVGNRYCWTLEDVMEAYANMPEDSSILRYNMTKWDVYNNLLSNSLEQFVDRETGDCFFDSQGFRSLVGFLENIPDEADQKKLLEAEEEVMWRIKHGQQMLEGLVVVWPRSIPLADTILQERAAFVGYPTADGSSGSFFYANGNILAMSSSCWNKEAAWDFIRQLITPRSAKTNPFYTQGNIPINQHDYELLCWGEVQQAKDLTREFQKEAPKFYGTWRHFVYGPGITLARLPVEEDIQRYRDLVDHTTQLYWPDDDLSNIVWETLGPYFAGDKTLDQTVALLNNRVGLYLNEQR